MTAPRVALGAMYLGTRLDDEASFALLDRYVELGGIWIDTANCYAFWESDTGSGGQSEAVIGRWLAARPGLRDHVRISTKVGAEPAIPGGYPGRTEGLSAPAIATGVRESLARLGVERVDLFWAHKQDDETDFAETVESLAGVVVSGQAAAIGYSNHPAWQVAQACAHRPAPVAIQHRHTYLQPRPPVESLTDHPFGVMTPEMLDLARSAGLEPWAYTALVQGAYDRPDRHFEPPYDHPGSAERLAVLRTVADELGVSRGEVVLAWLAGGEQPIRPIVGGSRPEQLDHAIAGVTLQLDDDQRQRLDDAGSTDAS